jgi:glycosyltransferase involved in cell wall biosynthesis
MASQTILPVLWVIVDDGSADNTPAILARARAQYPWIVVVQRRDRGFRKSGSGVVEAFYDGYALLENREWDFLVKLDGDLSFAADYFECCFGEFQANSRLGIGGGAVCFLEHGQPKVEVPNDPVFHVRGATKIYRRACWERIAPLVSAPGWDTVDEVKANMHGWQTRTFRNLRVVQHKPTGSADGVWLNWFKNGMANYVTGYHPLFMGAKCVKRAFSHPPLVAGLALGAGFCSGYLHRMPRVPDAAAIQYLRRQQLRRLLLQRSLYD